LNAQALLHSQWTEDGVDLNVIVGREKEAQDIKVALSSSFGFGGHNSVLLFSALKSP